MIPADSIGSRDNISALCLLEEIIKLNKDAHLGELLNTPKSLISHEGGKLLEEEALSYYSDQRYRGGISCLGEIV